MLVGLIAIMSCHLIDSAFVGQLGPNHLAVIGFSLPIYQLVIGVQVGLGIATTAIISRALGANNECYAKNLAALVVTSGFILILALCLSLWLNQTAIVGLLGADTELQPLFDQYWAPWLFSCWLGAMLYFGYSIFRAQGETLLPGKVMVLTSIINILLDPLFIFYFDMGLAGAAWATCVAFFSGCLIIYYQIAQQHLVQIPKHPSIITKGLRQLFAFTASSMTSQFIPPISAMFATVIVASHGDLVVAAWGLGSRIELLSIIVILALTMALPPMVGRLRGSKEIDQIHELVKTSIKFVLLWQLLIASILALGSIPISGVFTDNQLVAETFSFYLWIVPLSYGALGVCMIMVSVCSAMGMPNMSIVISIVRLFVCYLPALWIGSKLADTNGLFTGVVIGNITAGYLSWRIYKNLISSLLNKYHTER